MNLKYYLVKFDQDANKTDIVELIKKFEKLGVNLDAKFHHAVEVSPLFNRWCLEFPVFLEKEVQKILNNNPVDLIIDGGIVYSPGGVRKRK
jgi:hypothetical protein